MAALFDQELPKLKLFFFQLDRITGILSPQLQAHLKEESINSGFFASAWFITLFTNSLKKNQSEEFKVNESLLQVWDYFLIEGWPAISKIALMVLRRQEEQIIDAPFEDILNLI